jgi:hypothetical protein
MEYFMFLDILGPLVLYMNKTKAVLILTTNLKYMANCLLKEGLTVPPDSVQRYTVFLSFLKFDRN